MSKAILKPRIIMHNLTRLFDTKPKLVSKQVKIILIEFQQKLNKKASARLAFPHKFRVQK